MTEGKTIQCRAAVSWGANQPLKIETISVAPPQAGEVRIRVHSASICHTDITLSKGIDVGFPKPLFPVILGHECAGVVESIGEGVESVKPGDSVLPCAMPQCRKCIQCFGNKTNACLTLGENLADGSIDFGPTKTTRYICNGKAIFHFEGVSAFSEYIVCRESSVAKINKMAPLDKVSPISCGILTGYGAAVESAKVTKGSIVTVWGLGTVGLAAIAGCRHLEAGRIIAIDTNSSKFERAKRIGATHALNPSDPNFAQALMEATGGKGCDYAIECVGHVDVVRQAIASTNELWGTTITVGAPSVDARLEVGNSMQFVLGRTLKGSWMGGIKALDHVTKLVEEYLNGRIPLDDIITHRVSLDQVNEGFELLSTGKCVKTVINMI